MVHRQLNYANVVASVALFAALGGTAVAATLARDSVGAPQIREDGVRPAEIIKDAVRSPEIASGAVRSSEIRDDGVNFADISTGAASALRGDVQVTEQEDRVSVPECRDLDLRACSDLLVLPLAAGASPGSRQAPSPGPQQPEGGRNWLIQAKLDVFIELAPADNSGGENRCGLVNPAVPGPAAVLDQLPTSEDNAGHHILALSAVVKKSARNPTIALRCTAQPAQQNVVAFAKITALEVGAVTAP